MRTLITGSLSGCVCIIAAIRNELLVFIHYMCISIQYYYVSIIVVHCTSQFRHV